MGVSKNLVAALLLISIVIISGVKSDRKVLLKTNAKEQCKQIGTPPIMAGDNVAGEVVNKLSGKIIEYYNWFFRAKKANNAIESRTFGRIKRLQNALVPVVFAMGVLFTMIKIILFLTAKSVGIGILILMINFAFIVAKMAIFFKEYTAHKHGGWAVAGHGHGLQKDVHLHVHPTTAYGKPVSYGGWDRTGYKGSYITSGDQIIPYSSWLPQAAKEEVVSGEETIIKRSATNVELPHKMGKSPPTIDPVQLAHLKERRLI